MMLIQAEHLKADGSIPSRAGCPITIAHLRAVDTRVRLRGEVARFLRGGSVFLNSFWGPVKVDTRMVYAAAGIGVSRLR